MTNRDLLDEVTELLRTSTKPGYRRLPTGRSPDPSGLDAATHRVLKPSDTDDLKQLIRLALQDHAVVPR